MIPYFFSYMALLIASLTFLPGKIFATTIAGRKLYRTQRFTWNWQLTFILTLIGLLAGLRGIEIGVDYDGYYDFYDYISLFGEFPQGYLLGAESGWHYLNLWAANIGIPAKLFFGVVSAITWIFFIKGSYRYQYLLPLMFFFAITSGFLFWTWSGIRQSISIMLFLFSIKYIIEKNPIMYLVIILSGALFHISILLMIPVYFASYVKYNKNVALIIYLLSFVLIGSFGFSLLTEPLIKIFGYIAPLKSYTRLLTLERFQEAREATGTNLGFILKSFFTVWIILRSDKIVDSAKEFKVYVLLYFVYAVMANIFFSVELAGRILQYFFICFPIVAAATVHTSTHKKDKYISLAFLSAFFALYLVSIYRMLSNALI